MPRAMNRQNALRMSTPDPHVCYVSGRASADP